VWHLLSPCPAVVAVAAEVAEVAVAAGEVAAVEVVVVELVAGEVVVVVEVVGAMASYATQPLSPTPSAVLRPRMHSPTLIRL